MTPGVTLSMHGPVAEVVLSRPEKCNALDLDTFDELTTAGETLKGEPDLRAVILRGEGAHFCTGLDVAMLDGQLAHPRAFARLAAGRHAADPANRFQKPVWIWRELPVPVIAALNGCVYGAGLQLALAADIRIAAPDTRLSIMEIRWGLIPDMGITTTLTRLVRIDVAKELAYTGRVVASGEALGLGLVTRIADDPLSEARRMTEDIAARSPDAVSACKSLFDRAWQCDEAEGLALEAALQASIIGRPHQREAVRAQREKRRAQFQ